MEAIVWLVILVVLVIVELATLALTTIWFAGGSLVALIVALCNGPVWLQVAAFLVVSVVLLIFTRPVLIKYAHKDKVKTNVDELIGKEVIVTKDIHNLKDEGQVMVNGVEWMARTKTNEQRISAGAIVRIEAVEGVKLIVKETGKEEEK
ncbi:MAG: NfeD family protein [Lachnospiraceae bacterium]|jgi:membrane protein implicated in regulation of membrane protease activity|nr:NfeD family protein [Lachnospiraceae bacterium]